MPGWSLAMLYKQDVALYFLTLSRIDYFGTCTSVSIVVDYSTGKLVFNEEAWGDRALIFKQNVDDLWIFMVSKYMADLCEHYKIPENVLTNCLTIGPWIKRLEMELQTLDSLNGGC